MAYVIENVEALWPRLDRTYKFDQRENGGKGGSVPCAPSDQGAAYELSFKMTKDQATKLYQDMAAEFAKAKQPGWDEKLAMPFKKSEDGIFFIGKANLKGFYPKFGETSPPLQVDAQKNKMPADFQLTTGSTINLAVTFVPYKMSSCGVSLRINGVQVLDYREREQEDPFDIVPGVDAIQPTASQPVAPMPASDPFDLPHAPQTTAASMGIPDDEIPF